MLMSIRPKVSNAQSLKLHLGCFDRPIPGWINTDITPHIYVARIPGLPFLLYKGGMLTYERYQQHRQNVFGKVSYLDATAKFPFETSTFDHAFCSHFLEHLYPDGAQFCIKEVYRVLSAGGIFRIAVPDLDKVVAAYDPQNPDEFCEGVFEAKQKRDKNQHHWHYNEIALSRLLEGAGFRKVYRCEFQQGKCADVQVIDNRPGSLFMEAEK
jgi:predicted SAM-dependent methyltransferase